MINQPWTDAEFAILKRLLKKGLSAGKISKELSQAFGRPITRNAVIGKTHRAMGAGAFKRQPCCVDPESERQKKKARAVARAAGEILPRQKKTPPAPIAEIAPEFPGPTLVGLLDLTPRSCRFPFGDPRDETFHYCGATTHHAGDSYCLAHKRLCYVPAKKPSNTYVDRSRVKYAAGV